MRIAGHEAGCNFRAHLPIGSSAWSVPRALLSVAAEGQAMQITIPDLSVKEAESAKYAALAAIYAAGSEADMAGAQAAYRLAVAVLEAAKSGANV